MFSYQSECSVPATHSPWNKGCLIEPKPPLKLHEIWSIRIRLQMQHQIRELALFNLAIDSKLRACDLATLRVHDVAHGGKALSRASVIQHKTGRSVKFELTEQTRNAVEAWIVKRNLGSGDYLFQSLLI